MNVAVEMEKVRKKLQEQIDRDFLIAEAKVFGMSPISYALQLDHRREQARKAAQEQARVQAANAAVQMGRNLRAIRDSWVSMLENIARGFNGD